VNQFLRLACCASILGLFFVGIYFVCPALLDDAGLDFSEWARCQQIFDSESERGEELSQRHGQSVKRLMAKDEIARDLIACKLSLAEAVKRFDDLPSPPARMHELIRLQFGGASDEESMSRHVIEWACQLLGDQPDKVAAQRARLENEMRANEHNAQDRP